MDTRRAAINPIAIRIQWQFWGHMQGVPLCSYTCTWVPSLSYTDTTGPMYTN